MRRCKGLLGQRLFGGGRMSRCQGAGWHQLSKKVNGSLLNERSKIEEAVTDSLSER
jgi:hypothetical protein